MAAAPAPHRDQTIVQALREAFRYPSFLLLMAGYFVCGFQVVFIGVHMPSYLQDKGLSPEVASYALALIGLFNVFGTYIAGSLGAAAGQAQASWPSIYLGRAVGDRGVPAGAAHAAVGLRLRRRDGPAVAVHRAADQRASWRRSSAWRTCRCWAASCSFSHQIGSFLGVWLGGCLYDRTGSYDIVWYIAIALGVFAALVNLPVKESAIARGRARSRPETCHAPAHAAIASCTPAGWPRRCWRWLGVFALYTQPGVPGDAGRPALGLLLSHDALDRASRLDRALVAPAAARRHGARRRLRRGPPHALVRAAAATAVTRRRPRRRRRSPPSARFGRGRAGRHRSTALALRRPALRRGGRHQLPVARRCCPTSWRRWRPAACCSTKPSPPATKRVGKPSRPDFLLQPGELLRRLRRPARGGLRRRLPGRRPSASCSASPPCASRRRRPERRRATRSRRPAPVSRMAAFRLPRTRPPWSN